MSPARELGGLVEHLVVAGLAVGEAARGASHHCVQLRFQRLGGESEPVVRLCGSLEGPVRASYEAGPTGYGLARALDRAGVECVVAAPGKIPRGATEKVKTDRRDAEHLVRLLLAGKLHPVERTSPRRRGASPRAWRAPQERTGRREQYGCFDAGIARRET